MPTRRLLWSPNRVLPEYLSVILHGPKNEQGEKVRVPTNGQPNQVRWLNYALFDEHFFQERRFTQWIYQNADVYPRRNLEWAEGVHAKDIQSKCPLFYPEILIIFFRIAWNCYAQWWETTSSWVYRNGLINVEAVLRWRRTWSLLSLKYSTYHLISKSTTVR